MTSDNKTDTTSAAADADTEQAAAAVTEDDAQHSDAPDTDIAHDDASGTSEAEGDSTPAGANATGTSEAKTADFSSVGTGAIAVVSAGLGLASITGTSLGDMLRFRKEIIGQIDLRSSGGGDQVEVAYGAPWDTLSLVNGVFALLAVILGGALVAIYAGRSDARQWVKAVALGGALLGVIGLGIAGGMYLDLFGSQPVLPQAPSVPGAGG
ncbi:hypothetical protein [Haloechinothrix halophila]|uniref:hypothetical protein n=1 Tax=Haloechinothrix halophila TaxID=1069073 RepID=UPI0003FC43B7|nr:hypothetical protein [Haloechinothrix halophila]